MLDGKIALVTGASRGLGQAIALHLARQGAFVAGTATSEAGAQKFQNQLKDEGLNGLGLVMNVTDQDQIDAALKLLTEQQGAPNILVNNAGITRDDLMLRMTQDAWDEVLDTDLTSLYRMTKSCLKPMVKARAGRIINITSVVGVMGNAGQANYAAAKAGMIGFSKSLARELGSRNITVNCVAPGFIDTDMTQALSETQQQAMLGQIPLGRLGQPEDIAATVAFLASPAAAYITGEVIHVNGGMYMI